MDSKYYLRPAEAVWSNSRQEYLEVPLRDVDEAAGFIPQYPSTSRTDRVASSARSFDRITVSNANRKKQRSADNDGLEKNLLIPQSSDSCEVIDVFAERGNLIENFTTPRCGVDLRRRLAVAGFASLIIVTLCMGYFLWEESQCGSNLVVWTSVATANLLAEVAFWRFPFLRDFYERLPSLNGFLFWIYGTELLTFQNHDCTTKHWWRTLWWVGLLLWLFQIIFGIRLVINAFNASSHVVRAGWRIYQESTQPEDSEDVEMIPLMRELEKTPVAKYGDLLKIVHEHIRRGSPSVRKGCPLSNKCPKCFRNFIETDQVFAFPCCPLHIIHQSCVAKWFYDLKLESQLKDFVNVTSKYAPNALMLSTIVSGSQVMSLNEQENEEPRQFFNTQ